MRSARPNPDDRTVEVVNINGTVTDRLDPGDAVELGRQLIAAGLALELAGAVGVSELRLGINLEGITL